MALPTLHQAQWILENPAYVRLHQGEPGIVEFADGYKQVIELLTEIVDATELGGKWGNTNIDKGWLRQAIAIVQSARGW